MAFRARPLALWPLPLTRFALRLTHFPRLSFLPFGHLIDGAGDVTIDGVGFPTPENVALAGTPNTDGCREGVALHESAVSHGGGETTSLGHGIDALHTCASYKSNAVSRSSTTNPYS